MSDEILKEAPKGATPPDVTMTFKDDYTFSAEATFEGKKSLVTGTYTLTDKALQIITMTQDGKPPTEAVKPMATTLSDDLKSFILPSGDGKSKMVKQ